MKYLCKVCGYIYDEEKKEQNLMNFRRTGYARFARHRKKNLQKFYNVKFL